MRLVEVVGASSPELGRRTLRRSYSPESSTMGSRSASRSPTRSPTPSHPPTQPLGESTLSLEYSRPERSCSSTPVEYLLPQVPPLIGISQAVRDDFAREEATQTQKAEVALSQAHERGLEAGDGFHFPSQIPRPSPNPASPSPSPTKHTNSAPPVAPATPTTPTTPTTPRRFHGGGFSRPKSPASSWMPFPWRGGSHPAGSRPRSTAARIDPEQRRRIREALGAGVEEARQRRREAIAAGVGQR